MHARMIVEDATHAALVDRLIRRVLEEVIQRHDAGHWLTLRDTEHWFEGAEDSMSWQGRQHLLPPMGHVLWDSHGDATAASEAWLQDSRLRRPSLRGTFEGKPLGAEALRWRLRLMSAIAAGAELVVIGVDTDGDEDKIEPVNLAVKQFQDVLILIAAPHQDAEAWLLAGLGELEPHERARHAEVRQELGFDPLQHPHRLTAHPNEAPTDAKRVLQRILADSRVSRSIPAEELAHWIARCFKDLDALQRVGEPCGLNAFVGAVRAELAPRLNLPPG